MHLTGQVLDRHVVTLPPLAEQHRTVKRVDKLMSLLDRLEAARTARDEARRAARDAALAALRDAPDPDAVEAAWSCISHYIDSLLLQETDVACVHDAILPLAVQGRLVRQNPQDQDISQTIERARTHRLVALDTWSRSNSEGESILRKLAAHEQPVPRCSIPRGWACVSLLDATFAVVDCHNKTAPYTPSGVPMA